MLKLYFKTSKIFDDRTGECIAWSLNRLIICDEKEAVSTKESLTWEKIVASYERFSGLEVYTRKKGSIVKFYSNRYRKKCRKSWKENLDMSLTVEYSEFHGSLLRILDYYDYRKLIEYLKQEGISLNV